jgi:hypothetical protein
MTVDYPGPSDAKNREKTARLSHPLDGARAKVERAKEHIRYLNDEIVAARERKTHTIETEVDKNTYTIVKRLRVHDQLPVRWAVVVGEVASNLRTALDHVVWELVRANKQTGDTRTEFPVFWSAKEYKANGVRKIKGTVAPAQAIVDGLQPYHRGDGFAADPLYRLHHLNLEDKHRTLNLVRAAAVVRGMPGIVPTGPIAYVDYYSIQTPGTVHALEDGAELLRLEVSPHNINVQVHLHVSVFIAFDQAGPGQGEAVIPLLTQLADFTERVIELFNPFFP